MTQSFTASHSETQVTPALSLWIKVLFIFLALFKLWLVEVQPITAINLVHDDRLFLNLAHHLLSGEWLGPYNQFTLIKGSVYPLWIATAFVLGLPLLLSQHLLYIAACGAFIQAVRPLVQRPLWLVLIYSALLFNPMSYTAAMTRVIRGGIYPALTLFVVAMACGFLLRYQAPLRTRFLWVLGLGISLALFWLTREGGIWLIPLVLFFIGLSAVKLARRKPLDYKGLGLCLVPFIIWGAGVAGIALINFNYYGVFRTNDVKSAPFLAAYGALTRVKHEHWRPTVPVSAEVRERVYRVSPAFAELKPFLERKGAWRGHPSLYGSDIGGAHFMWALRWAAALKGYYRSASSADAYYWRLANEVNKACKEKRLECGPKRATLMPPWHSEYTIPLLHTLWRATLYLVQFKGFEVTPRPSRGSKEDFQFYREITHSRLSPPRDFTLLPGGKIRMRGWVFSRTQKIRLEIRDKNGKLITASIPLQSSLGVYEHFAKKNIKTNNAKRARFNVTFPCIKDCFLYIYGTQERFKRVPLDGSVKAFNNNDLYFYLDYLGRPQAAQESPYLPQALLDHFKINTLQSIASLYQAIIPFLFILALILYLYQSIHSLKNRKILLSWWIGTGLVLILSARLLMLSLIDVTSFPAINTLYMSSAYPLLLIFIFLTISYHVKWNEIVSKSYSRVKALDFPWKPHRTAQKSART